MNPTSFMAVKHSFGVASTLALALAPVTLACGGCYAPANHIEHVRHVKRMQPDALNASYGPSSALEWGQLNFLHTVRRFPRIPLLLPPPLLLLLLLPRASTVAWTGLMANYVRMVDRYSRLARRTSEGEELWCRLGRLRHLFDALQAPGWQ